MDPLDLRLMALARGQRGLFSRKQASGLGLTEGQICHRVTSGRWMAVRPGIFVFEGTRVDWQSEQLATVAWSGGVSSHRAAARLYGLPGFDEAEFEVTTYNTQVMSRCGISVHHTNRMPREQIATPAGLPCTSVERTLLDLGAVVSPGRVAVALDHALMTGMTTLGSLDFCLYLTARRGRRGCRTLRELIRKRIGLGDVPNSPLETVIFEFLVSFGFPLPHLQLEIRAEDGRFIARPDFVYPDRRAVIEGHSKKWHSEPEKQKRDAARHNDLVLDNYRILYITWYDVTVSRLATAQRVESFLEGGPGDIRPPEIAMDVTKEW